MIYIDLGSLCTLGTTTTTTCDDGIRISGDSLATTLTASISTASTSNADILIGVHAAAARDYVASMSTQELDDLISQIDEREEVMNKETPKVKKLGNINGRNI